MRLRSGVLLVTGFLCAGGVVSAQEPSRTPPPPAVSGKKSIVSQSQQPLGVTRVENEAPVPTENAPQPIGFESDIYCFGYVGDLSERFPVQVKGGENLGA